MTPAEYFVLPWYKKFFSRISEMFKKIIIGLLNFFKSIPKNISSFFRNLGNGFRKFGLTFAKGGILTKLSYVIMGAGNLFRGQIVRGFLFLAAEIAYIWYMITNGAGCIAGLKTLGTVQRGWYFDEELGIDVMRENGDNSMLILLYGILALFVTAVF